MSAISTDGEVMMEWVPIEHAAEASVVERLAAIVSELPAIGKDARNTQQNFDYRSHDDVLNALNPLLSKYGVVFVPSVVERIASAERTTSGGKTMYEVNLHVLYRIYGAKGDYIEASAWGEGTDMGDKSTNKAMTMAFKNVLAQTFAISTGEGYDTDAHSPEETTRGRAANQAPGAHRTPAEPRAFDPAVDLLPGAIEGADAAERIAQALAEIDQTMDWQATLHPLIAEVFGVATRQEIPAERMHEFWRRMSNFCAKAAEHAGEIIIDEDLLGMLAWAFNGATTTIVLKPEIQAAEDALAAEALAAAEADTEPPGQDPVSG